MHNARSNRNLLDSTYSKNPVRDGGAWFKRLHWKFLYNYPPFLTYGANKFTNCRMLPPYREYLPYGNNSTWTLNVYPHLCPHKYVVVEDIRVNASSTQLHEWMVFIIKDYVVVINKRRWHSTDIVI